MLLKLTKLTLYPRYVYFEASAIVTKGSNSQSVTLQERSDAYHTYLLHTRDIRSLRHQVRGLLYSPHARWT